MTQGKTPEEVAPEAAWVSPYSAWIHTLDL